MKVSAIVVTRGDVDLQPVLDSLPVEWEKVVWDNGNHLVEVDEGSGGSRNVFGVPGETPVPDLKVYGRYEAIKYARHDLIYVADDDCIVSDPQAIGDAYCTYEPTEHGRPWGEDPRIVVACNMPQRFRDAYPDSGLVGFGAAFHRDAPERAFARLRRSLDVGSDELLIYDHGIFLRECDAVFTGLTPRVLVDVPYVDREFASDPGRMWTTPGHIEERSRMLDLVRQVRDA